MEKLLGKLKTGIVFVVSAPAGTGKTTLIRMLEDEFPCIAKSISCTTRPMRAGEIAEKDYHFISPEEFAGRLKKGEFLEHAQVFGQSYGTLKAHVEAKQQEGKHVILVIDTQGAEQLKESGYEAVFIFLRPPSLAELRARLFKRKTEATEHIEERLAWAQNELAMSRLYDYQIVNDNLHRAYEILRSILIAEEHKQERYNDGRHDQ